MHGKGCVRCFIIGNIGGICLLYTSQISDTEKQIVKAQEDYDAAKAQEDAQYLAMKKRLRYLYEKGDTRCV